MVLGLLIVIFEVKKISKAMREISEIKSLLKDELDRTIVQPHTTISEKLDRIIEECEVLENVEASVKSMERDISTIQGDVSAIETKVPS